VKKAREVKEVKREVKAAKKGAEAAKKEAEKAAAEFKEAEAAVSMGHEFFAQCWELVHPQAAMWRQPT
jgi:hypothetical protein